MATAKYAFVVEALPEIAGDIYCEASELIGAGLGGCEVRFGDQIFLYGPCGQWVRRGQSVMTTLLDRRGANDDSKPAQKNLSHKTVEPALTIAQSIAMRLMPSGVRSRYLEDVNKQRPKMPDRSGVNLAALKVWQSQQAHAQENTPKPGRSFRKQLEFALLALYLAA